MANREPKSDDELEEIYQEIRDSFELSMRAEDIDQEKREAVLNTVDDNIGNIL